MPRLCVSVIGCDGVVEKSAEVAMLLGDQRGWRRAAAVFDADAKAGAHAMLLGVGTRPVMGDG